MRIDLYPPSLDPEKTEAIKRDYSSHRLRSELTVLWIGDDSGSQREKAYAERFRQQAMEIINMLQDPAEAEAYRERLDDICLRGLASKDSAGDDDN